MDGLQVVIEGRWWTVSCDRLGDCDMMCVRVHRRFVHEVVYDSYNVTCGLAWIIVQLHALSLPILPWWLIALEI